MKKFLTGFFVGTVLTAYIGTSLYLISDHQTAQETVDLLIGEWTTVKSDSSSPALAQVAAKKELPNARVGFFPDTVLVLSQLVESHYHVPKGVVLAQWALESSWGRKNLGVSNYFGHTFPATKKFMNTPKCILLPELVHQQGMIRSGKPTSFSAYSNIAECFDVHGQYLSSSPLYAKAFKQPSPEKFARELSKHYATDPDYALKLITIMRRYKL